MSSVDCKKFVKSPLLAVHAGHGDLYAAALSQLLRHDLAGCPRAALQAADLLDRLADQPEIDAETRQLCERMSRQLAGRSATRCA